MQKARSSRMQYCAAEKDVDLHFITCGGHGIRQRWAGLFTLQTGNAKVRARGCLRHVSHICKRTRHSTYLLTTLDVLHALQLESRHMT